MATANIFAMFTCTVCTWPPSQQAFRTMTKFGLFILTFSSNTITHIFYASHRSVMRTTESMHMYVREFLDIGVFEQSPGNHVIVIDHYPFSINSKYQYVRDSVRAQKSSRKKSELCQSSNARKLSPFKPMFLFHMP